MIGSVVSWQKITVLADALLLLARVRDERLEAAGVDEVVAEHARAP